jgi:hypothetical protein
MLVFFRPFVQAYCHVVYFVVIWYISSLLGIFSHFGMLCQEKSGNPDVNSVPSSSPPKGF